MKKHIKHLLIPSLIMSLFSCSGFLEYEPKGVLSSENVRTPSNAESLVIAAYAGIGNDEMIGPMTSL